MEKGEHKGLVLCFVLFVFVAMGTQKGGSFGIFILGSLVKRAGECEVFHLLRSRRRALAGRCGRPSVHPSYCRVLSFRPGVMSYVRSSCMTQSFYKLSCKDLIKKHIISIRHLVTLIDLSAKSFIHHGALWRQVVILVRSPRPIYNKNPGRDTEAP